MDRQQQQNYTTPNQIGQLQDSIASITKLLTQIPDTLNTLRREFRGEALYEGKNGQSQWIQISKPIFVLVDIITKKPKMEEVIMPWKEKKKIYLPNDEAIDEVLSMLKFMGINQISPLGFNNQDNYLDDLLEFECKLAAVLCLKQADWGLDEDLLPMVQMKIKTIVQDTRSLSLNGKVLGALQTTIQRMETLTEGIKPNKLANASPYG